MSSVKYRAAHQHPSEIAFVDRNVSELAQLRSGLRQDVECVLLDSGRDAIAQIAEALAARQPVETVHILAHGRAGEITFAAAPLSLETIEAHADELSAIGNALGEDGGLLLWSCHTGAGARGGAFRDALADATGARVAASSSLVGAADKGGSWQLDSYADARSPLTPAGMEAYSGVMTAAPTITSFSIDSNGDLIVNGTGSNGNGWTIGLFEATAPNAPTEAAADMVSSTFALVTTTKGMTGALGIVPDVNGQWTVNLGSASAFIGKELAAAAFNNGNPNTESPLSNVVVVGLAPTAPSITGISPDTGSSSTDGITNVSNVTVSGVAAANTTITLYDNGGVTPIGTATTDSTGHWSISNITLTAGTNNLTATASNYGGTSASSSVFVADYDNDSGLVTSVAVGYAAVNASEVGAVPFTIHGLEAGDSWTVTFQEGSQTYTLSGTADANGNFSGVANLGGQFTDGTISVTMSSTDVAGNVLTASTSFVLDTTPPVVTAGLANDTGASPTDGLTNDATLSGTGEANSTVSISIDGGVAVTVSTDANGHWTYTPAGLSDGGHTVSVSQTDAAGNVGSTSTGFTLDATPPTVTAGLADDSGSSQTDGITNDPALSGTAEANSTVSISVDGGAAVTVSTDANGNWTYTPTGLSDGGHTVSVSQTDAAGNVGSTSSSFTLDTTPPTVTAGLADDSGSSHTDGLTNDPALSGTAEANSTVSISIDGGAAVTVSTDANGNWTYAPTGLSDGGHSVSVSQTDAAGNTGSTSTSFTLDTTPPTVTAGLADDSGSSQTDGLTNDATLSGTGEANSTVSISIDGGAAVTVSTDANGNWTYTPTGLQDGGHTVSVSQTDAAGNVGSTSTGFTLDTTAPTVTAGLADDSGSSHTDGITNDAALSGTGEANSTVSISVDGGAAVTVSTDANGNWTYTPTGLQDGSHNVSVSQTDAAGNTGSTSTGFTLDTTAPTVTAGLADDSGASHTDGITNDATLSGTGEANSTVSISVDNGAAVTVSTDANGNWTYTPTGLHDGGHTVSVSQTDAAGNTGSTSTSFTLDTTPPAPTIALAHDTGFSATDKLTNNDALTGTGDPNAIVVFREGTTVIGTTVAGADGSWSFTPSGLHDGVHTITASETDLAGNTGTASLTFTLDSTPDSKPVINTIDTANDLSLVQYWTAASPTPVVIDGYSRSGSFTIEGTGVKGDSVTLWDNNHSGVFNTTAITVDATGHWSYTVTGLAQGEHSFQAIQTDGAGNQSPISNTYDVIVDSTGPSASITGVSATVGKTSTTYTISGSYADNLSVGTVKVMLDGTTTLAANITNSSVNGAWSLSTAGLTNAVHYFTAQATDLAGNHGAVSAAWVFGTSGADTLTFGNGSLPTGASITGGAGNDAFNFTGSFGNDTVTDFGSGDTLHFATAQFANLTALLSHAQQVSGNVIITLDSHDTVTLLNTKLAALTSKNVIFG